MEQIRVEFTKSAQQRVVELVNKKYSALGIYHDFQPVAISKAQGRNEERHYIHLSYIEDDNTILSLYMELQENEAICISVKKLPITYLQNASMYIKANTKFSMYKAYAFSSAMKQQIKLLKTPQQHSEIIQTRMERWDDFLRFDFEEAQKDIVAIKLKVNRKLDDETYSATITNTKRDIRQWAIYKVDKQKSINTYEDFMSCRPSLIGTIIEPQKKQKNLYKIKLYRDEMNKGTYYAINRVRIIKLERQLAAIRALKMGRVANQKVEEWIFGEVVDLITTPLDLPRKKLFNQNLNEKQYEAVKSALGANDLYCIQGPPGTGKTTVITEICFQNTQRGLKTLVTSQSNLAVDNVLANLMVDVNLLLLRMGNPERVEEEGLPFIEKNVIYNWLESIVKLSTENLIHLQRNQTEPYKKKLETLTKEKNAFKNELSGYAQKKKELHQKNDDFLSELDFNKQRMAKVEHNYKVAVEEGEDFANNILLTTMKQRKADSNKQLSALIKSEVSLSQRLTTHEQHLGHLQMAASISEHYYETKTQCESILSDMALYEQRYQQHQATIKAVVEDLDYAASLGSQHPLNIRESLPYYLKKYRLDYDLTQFHQEVEKFKKIDRKLADIKYKKNYYDTIEIQVNHLFVERKITTPPVLPMSYSQLSIEEASQELINYVYKQPRQLGGGRTQYITTQQWWDGLCSAYTHFILNGQQIIRVLQQFSHERNQFIATTHLGAINKDIQHQLTMRMEAEKERLNQKNMGEEYFEKLQHTLQEKEALIQYFLQSYPSLAGLSSLTSYYQEMKQIIETVIRNKDKLNHLQNEKKQLTENMQKQQLDIENFMKVKEERRQQLLLNIHLIEKEARMIHLEKKRTIGKQRIHAYEIDDLTSQINKMQQQINKVEEKYQKEERRYKEKQGEERDCAILAELQRQWIKEINQITDSELQRFTKTYVKHANVIGVTCIQAGAPHFKENFDEFDVIIIDEVSKATPPELLIPVLKGKKVILVGDHKQLPPIIEEKVVEQLLEGETYTASERIDVKNYYKESLFERLFMQISPDFKMTLTTQYRMHPQMMDLIQPFYQNQGLNLKCGLSKPDEQRAHHLAIPPLQLNDHVIWLDMPNTKDYYEESVQKSYRNMAEVNVIKQTVMAMLRSIQEQKQQGALSPDYQKSIGIISFYSQQIVAIENMLKELGEQQEIFQHADFRVGTVDRFQGMEREVIIISFVRNNQGRNIGFARDPRRVNVALSRAQQLLVIIGSSDNFRGEILIYKQIIEKLQRNKRLINAQEMV